MRVGFHISLPACDFIYFGRIVGAYDICKGKDSEDNLWPITHDGSTDYKHDDTRSENSMLDPTKASFDCFQFKLFNCLSTVRPFASR